MKKALACARKIKEFAPLLEIRIKLEKSVAIENIPIE